MTCRKIDKPRLKRPVLLHFARPCETEVDVIVTSKHRGNSFENLVVEDENGFPLTTQSEKNILQVETLGSSNILINYDTYSLISKDGKIWSFEIDSPVEFNMIMPQNSVIVGMSTFPIDMDVTSDRTQILLPSGMAEITYFLAVAESSQVSSPEETSVTNDDNSMIYVAGGAAVAIAAIAAIAIKMKNKPKQIVTSPQTTIIEEKNEPFNIEKVLEMPDLREDDKEIIKFIHENGGSALESDLRKKFLLPRTTMWRAVKRLEREGLITIEKRIAQLHAIDVTVVVTAIIDIHFIQFSRAKFI